MRSLLKNTILILLVWLFLPGSLTFASQENDVVFYPTDVSQAGDLAYLHDSVRLMLASRLANVAGGTVRLEKKMDKGRDIAHYRVISSIVNTADGVTLSVQAFKPFAESPLHFQSVAGDSAEIMKALDLLVADVGNALFQEQDSPEKGKPSAEKAEKDIDLATSHPDRAFKNNSGFGLSIGQDDFIAEMGLKVHTAKRYKSTYLPVRSQGMTAGDIDGDSLDEILISANTKLYIFQLRNGKIHPLVTIPLPGGLQVHALNVADLDNNGVAEIYLSATKGEEPQSFVLEWHPVTGLKWLHKYVYWYLRPLNIPGEGLVLGGQRSGVSSMIRPGIFRMTFGDDGKITAGEPLNLPDPVNLFDFIFADLEGDTLPEIVTINRKEQLLVYSSALQLLYTSPSGFGGRELSEGITVPIRLVASDFNNDGKHDILIVDNELYSPKIMSDTRLYKNGQVRGLLWTIDGFVEMWHTNLFQKAVVDFQFFSSGSSAETGTTARGRLFVVEPEKGDLLEGFLLGTGGSQLSVYDMDFISEETQKAE